MSEPAANDDLELLRQFTRDHSQAAFTALVQRHVNLVYSAALRQVRSPQLAEDVTQSTFADLARNAAKLTNAPAAAPVLAAWLYQVARHTAVDVVRKESRRQLREQIAVEMNAMNTEALPRQSEAAAGSWTEIEPLLDEAVAALDETDRAAVLLRYFENQSLRAVGQQLGVSDDAAQKRVSRAVERLREFFAKRGVSVGAGGLVVVISANAVQAAPVGLAVTISAAALAGTAATTSTIIAATSKTIAMTTLQKTLVTATVAVLAGAGIYEARQAAQLRDQVQTLQQQQAPLAEQIQKLQSERDEATNMIAGLKDELATSEKSKTELLKLRNQLTLLQNSQNDPLDIQVRKWLENVQKLKRRLLETPEAEIPEMKFLTKNSWLDAGHFRLETEVDYRNALSHLRYYAEAKFVSLVHHALGEYLAANNFQFPNALEQLRPFLDKRIDDAMLQRWEIKQANLFRSNIDIGDTVITQKGSPIDEVFDQRWLIGQGYTQTSYLDRNGILVPLRTAFMEANGFQAADDKQLIPYAKTEEEKKNMQQMLILESVSKTED